PAATRDAAAVAEETPALSARHIPHELAGRHGEGRAIVDATAIVVGHRVREEAACRDTEGAVVFDCAAIVHGTIALEGAVAYVRIAAVPDGPTVACGVVVENDVIHVQRAGVVDRAAIQAGSAHAAVDQPQI